MKMDRCSMPFWKSGLTVPERSLPALHYCFLGVPDRNITDLDLDCLAAVSSWCTTIRCLNFERVRRYRAGAVTKVTKVPFVLSSGTNFRDKSSTKMQGIPSPNRSSSEPPQAAAELHRGGCESQLQPLLSANRSVLGLEWRVA